MTNKTAFLNIPGINNHNTDASSIKIQLKSLNAGIAKKWNIYDVTAEKETGKREEGTLKCPEECLIEDKGQREKNTNNNVSQQNNVRASSQRLYGLYAKGFVDSTCVNWLVDTGAARSILSRIIAETLLEF